MTQKNTQIWPLILFIWSFIKKQPVSFFFILILSFTWSLDATIWPYILRLIVDTLTAHEIDRTAAWDSLKPLFGVAICFWFYVEVAFRTRDLIRSYAIPKLEANIRTAMFDHVEHHSPRYFNEHFAGSLSNKISDMTTHVTSMIQTLMVFIPAVIGSFLILFFFSKINPLFSLLLGTWILIHFTICLSFTIKCVKLSKEHGEARSTLAGKIVDSLTNNFAVNLFYRFKFESLRIGEFQKIEQETYTKSLLYSAYMLISLSVLFFFAMIALNGLLIHLWMANKITTGEVIQVFNSTFNVIMILWIAGDLMPQFYQSIGIASQSYSLMKDPQDVIDPENTPALIVSKGEIVFKNVSFQYGEKSLFNNKHVHIKGGEKVGLVGYSGAGKSTFVNLILRFFPIDKGEILIDNQNIEKITLESLRSQVALIPQDPILFHRTLFENIQYGNLSATDEDVIKSAKLAHCDEFIRRCPKGYSSLVGERGTKLSGGERQRIAIARAMLAASPILILDEATSSLDSVTEHYIQESLDSLMVNRTTIVIAHRLSTLAKMDRILVFDQGKIVEEGSHEELLARSGHYSKLWNMQAGGFLPERPG